MKQNIPTENKGSFSQSPIPPRFRAPSSKESLRSEAANGLSPGLKTRPKSVAPETNNGQKARRSLGLNKVKSGEDLGAQKGRGMDEMKPIGRPGNRVVEQYARIRRRADPNCKKMEDDPEGKRKGLQQRLEVSEKLVKDLQSEASELKEQLKKLQSFNMELTSQNRQFAEDLSAAEAKILALSSQKRESVVEEVQSPGFRDVQKLIASKLENFGAKKEISKEVRAVEMKSISFQPVAKAAEVQSMVSINVHPPPPPLPPLPWHATSRAGTTQKAPALVEFYHSLMKCNGQKDAKEATISNKSTASSAHSSIVGEIENRSAHLLAIKADAERKGDFIKFLIQKVQTAAYTDIEDVLTFIEWLDKELSTLADERAVLKHFEWPERKADAMREGAFEYRALKRLQSEISSLENDASTPCETALKNMTSLLDKSEQSIQRLTRLRASTMLSYKECKIPTDWMLDTGMVSKIKLASLKLANMYMKRASVELESIQHSDRESSQEALLLQCVRFAYRAHQFAGGLDSETMCAFEEIRQRVPMQGSGSRELLAGIPSS